WGLRLRWRSCRRAGPWLEISFAVLPRELSRRDDRDPGPTDYQREPERNQVAVTQPAHHIDEAECRNATHDRGVPVAARVDEACGDARGIPDAETGPLQHGAPGHRPRLPRGRARRKAETRGGGEEAADDHARADAGDEDRS